MNDFLGLASALAGCSCVYFASPNQGWRARSLPALLGRVAGAALLTVGLIAFTWSMQAVVAVFTFAHVLMLLFILLPYLGAFVTNWRERQRP
jgi:1,4-dihydroxy-2-naphthoate octaprenyltransferase